MLNLGVAGFGAEKVHLQRKFNFVSGHTIHFLSVDIHNFQAAAPGQVVPIRGHDPRFGEDYDHWAFCPDPLPVDIQLSQATWQLVGEGMLALGRLDQAGCQVPDAFVLRRGLVRREAQSTSALEGTVAPLEDVLEADPDDFDEDGQTAEVSEVLNYVRAAEYAYAWVGGDLPISLTLLLDVHNALVRSTKADGPQAGKIRTQQVVIGPPSTRVQDARFVPMPPGADLEASVRDLMTWIESRTPSQNVLVSAAMAHYQFETLHPFNDGNGRIGRLIIVLQLLRSGTLREALLTVSPWFEARRREYQDQLQRLGETGNWDAWVGFFATGIRSQAESTSKKVSDLLAYRDEVRALARSQGLRGVAIDIIETLITRPVFSISSIADVHRPITPQAVGAAVRRLVDQGVLVETTGAKYGRVFASPRVLSILQA